MLAENKKLHYECQWHQHQQLNIYYHNLWAKRCGYHWNKNTCRDGYVDVERKNIMMARLFTTGLGQACFFILSCWILSPSPNQAQIFPSVNLFTSYTDNLFKSSNKRADWINQVYFDLDYIFNHSFNLYYNGNANQFNENDDLFSQTHTVGLGYVKQWDTRNLVLLGIDLSTRRGKSAYEYRDMVDVSTYINAKLYLPFKLLARGGYMINGQQFLNASTYNFFDQTAFFKLSRSLPSLTTIQIYSALGLKTYAQNTQTNSTSLPERSDPSRNLLQWVGRFKIAQSLGSYTGLQIEYRKRTNLTGQSRYTNITLYNPNDDLFGDRYSYQGDTISTTLKHIAPANIILESSGRLEHRQYTNRLALDQENLPLASGATRKDKRQTLKLAASKDVHLAHGPAKSVRLQLEWLYHHNASNDFYYNADENTYTAGLNFTF